jgi:hypothetical protein
MPKQNDIAQICKSDDGSARLVVCGVFVLWHSARTANERKILRRQCNAINKAFRAGVRAQPFGEVPEPADGCFVGGPG